MTKIYTVSFQGERGAFSEIAVEKFFNSSVKTIPAFSFEDVFIKVKEEKAEYGIIPVENTLYGSVFENYDYLLKYKVFVVGELNLQINHCLTAVKKYHLNELRNIYSHPQALGQCSRFLKTLKYAELIPSYDTAGSALLAIKNSEKPSAAVTSARAAKLYGMKILKRNIQNNRINFTRFFVISKNKSLKKLVHPKSTFSFDLKSIPGALYKALGVFANAEIDLSMIESRPIPHKPFQYTFYIDISGSFNDRKVKSAFRKLSGLTITIRKIGSYEKGKTYLS